MGNRKHHTDDTPRRPLDDAQPRFIASCIAAHGFHAKHVAHILQLLNLVVEPAHLALFQLHPAQLFAAIDADPPYDPDHAPALFQAHICDFLLCHVCCAGSLIHGGKDAVPRSGTVGRGGCGSTAQGKAALSPLQLDTHSRDSIGRNIRNHLFLTSHLWLLQYLAADLDGIHDADNDGVNWRIFRRRRQAGRAALSEQDALAYSRAYAINGHHRAPGNLKLALSADVRLDQQQLHSKKLRVLLCRNNVANYLCNKHAGSPHSPCQIKSVSGYFGNTDPRLPCGRAITCTLCTSPTAFAAAAPASTAARTLPTSP